MLNKMKTKKANTIGKNIFIFSQGCEMRGIDAEKIYKYFSLNDYAIVNNPEDADYIIFITCAYLKTTADSSFEKIKQFQQYDAELIVAGCLPEIDKDKLKEIFNGKIIPTSDIDKIDDDKKRTDHGIASAILTMKALSEKYRIHQWNEEDFNKYIINACSAIFIHNLRINKFIWNFNDFPLASLLKICDELQDWDRPTEENIKGNSPKDYDLKFKKDGIIFYVYNSEIKKIRKKLQNIDNFSLDIENN